MKRTAFVFLSMLIAACGPCGDHVRNELRAPAYPLVTIDPFTSTWSAADRLYDAPTTHWTGAEHQLLGVLTVDGVPYRFLGQVGVEKKSLARISDKRGWNATYTTKKPSGKWMDKDYDDSGWAEGEGGFGSAKRKPMIHTVWDGPEIWVRRTFVIDAPLPSEQLEMFVRTNDYGTVYLNGIKVCDSGKTAGKYVSLPQEAMESLVEGENVIAAHCVNTDGTARLDLGLAAVMMPEYSFENTAEQFPKLSGVMLGRGAVMNPALFREIRGGERLHTEELIEFSEVLIERYRTLLGTDVFTLHKLKEIWIYVMWNFPGEKRIAKAIKKAATVPDFLSAISALPEL